MQTKLKLLALATVALAPMVLSGDLQAQQQPPQFPNMTFFITSDRRTQRRQLRRYRGRRQALPGACRQGRRQRQDLARLSQRAGQWRRQGGERARPHRQWSVGQHRRRADRVERRRPAFRQQQDHRANHPRRERPAHSEPALYRQPARHPHRDADGRDRATCRQGPDLQQLDQRQRRPGAGRSCRPHGRPATTRRRSRGIRRIRRAAAALRNWWRRAAPACSTASPRTDASTASRRVNCSC